MDEVRNAEEATPVITPSEKSEDRAAELSFPGTPPPLPSKPPKGTVPTKPTPLLDALLASDNEKRSVALDDTPMVNAKQNPSVKGTKRAPAKELKELREELVEVKEFVGWLSSLVFNSSKAIEQLLLFSLCVKKELDIPKGRQKRAAARPTPHTSQPATVDQYRKVRKANPAKKCYGCGSPRHVVRDCPKSAYCFKCTSPAHRTKDCPVAPSWETGPSPSGFDRQVDARQ